MAAMVGLHLVGLQSGNAGVRAENALPKGMIGKVCGHDVVVADERRLIVVHADFFEDDIFLHVKIVTSQRRLHQRRQ